MVRLMRVLHVTHQYRPAIGGSEQYIVDVSEELARRGHQVTVFTSRSRDYMTWRSELPRYERLDGVDVYRFRAFVRGGGTWRALRYGTDRYFQTRSRRYEPLIWLGNGPVCAGMVWAILRQARGYDLIHINNLHYAHSAPAYAAARWRGLPVVMTPHVHPEQLVTFDVGYLWSMLRGSDHVLAQTHAERQFLIESGLDSWRVTTGGVGIRPEQFPALDRQECRRALGLPGDAFVVLFLGRKTEYKGLHLVLEAVTRLKGQHPGLGLLAVGPETEQSQALWARNGGLDYVVNLGTVPDEVRLQALNACDCLALPSGGEAFGRVFLEAWAVGRPVIGGATRAVSSLIADGEDGYLVPLGSVDELTERLACLVAEPDLARHMGERGRAKVMSRYTVPRIADIVEGVYLRVLRRRRGAGATSREESDES